MWSSELGPSPGQGHRLVVFGKTLCSQPRSQGFSRPFHLQGKSPENEVDFALTVAPHIKPPKLIYCWEVTQP